jgi:hypothetical protein
MNSRIEELECIVDQLNDTSTQPASGSTAPGAATKEIKDLQEKIKAVEKQLHAAIGAKHRNSRTGEPSDKDRTPSVYQQFLSLEAFRKRLRNLEEIEGATKCARLLK